MRGKCKLCLADDVELQESHFLSKGIYRALRVNLGTGNPNPWQITPEGAVQTSKQVWAHLLCAECELRFSKFGEDWIFRNGLKHNGSFRLASVLAASPFAIDSSGMTRVYRAAGITKVNVPALTYFAASMFWRASVHPWKLDGTTPVPLGPFEEPLRQYLMGETEFPVDMTVAVVVRLPSDISHFTHEPMGEWRGQLLVAKFPMPGFAFSITAGVDIPAHFRRMCFVRGDGNPIFMSGALEQHILDEGVKMMRRSQQKGH